MSRRSAQSSSKRCMSPEAWHESYTLSERKSHSVVAVVVFFSRQSAQRVRMRDRLLFGSPTNKNI